MLFQRDPVWRTPEELVEIGFQRSSVVMMNEAHNGLKRCIRTRQIGQRILPTAHRAGVRHLAMEALHPPYFAEQCNRTRQPPTLAGDGYLSQPDMQEFIRAALELGWTLVPYEADAEKWLSTKFDAHFLQSEASNETRLAALISEEYTNWREEQQALNLISVLNSLPANTPLLVWCGNGHLGKITMNQWLPMGYQFQKHSNINPFAIDQTRTVTFDEKHSRSAVANKFSTDLLKYSGTAGFLMQEAPAMIGKLRFADAYLLSTENAME